MRMVPVFQCFNRKISKQSGTALGRTRT
uniref:Uncharacterized protein n=1 Tax=Arundo donax TaxID=35708 RepID=A0A0A9GSW6_ARUDO